jgi:DNA-binding GntR family transcriptional regulator
MASTPARRLLADRAYDALKSSLQSGKYPPGTFLSERQLAARAGHEQDAAQVAPSSGWSRRASSGSRRSRGSWSASRRCRRSWSCSILREAIETFVVQRIAGKLGPNQISHLRENVREQAEAVRKSNVADATRLDTEFHYDGLRLPGQPGDVADAVADAGEAPHPDPGEPHAPAAALETSYREHAAIAAALIKGRADHAADLVRKHLDYGRNLVLGRESD